MREDRQRRKDRPGHQTQTYGAASRQALPPECADEVRQRAGRPRRRALPRPRGTGTVVECLGVRLRHQRLDGSVSGFRARPAGRSRRLLRPGIPLGHLQRRQGLGDGMVRQREGHAGARGGPLYPRGRTHRAETRPRQGDRLRCRHRRLALEARPHVRGLPRPGGRRSTGAKS